MSEQLNADRPKTRRKEPAGRGSASEQKILAAAKELFLADRYDGVNLERIAARAGVSRQTVYNRFGSKETVFREMVRHHWSAFAGPGRDIAECGPDASAEEVLRGFAQSLQRFATETDQIRFAQLVVTESARLPWIADEFYRLGRGRSWSRSPTASTAWSAEACFDARTLIWQHVSSRGSSRSSSSGRGSWPSRRRLPVRHRRRW